MKKAPPTGGAFSDYKTKGTAVNFSSDIQRALFLLEETTAAIPLKARSIGIKSSTD